MAVLDSMSTGSAPPTNHSISRERKGTDLFSNPTYQKYQHKHPQPHLTEMTVCNTYSEQPKF
jgi:hypothetical protein